MSLVPSHSSRVRRTKFCDHGRPAAITHTHTHTYTHINTSGSDNAHMCTPMHPLTRAADSSADARACPSRRASKHTHRAHTHIHARAHTSAAHTTDLSCGEPWRPGCRCRRIPRTRCNVRAVRARACASGGGVAEEGGVATCARVVQASLAQPCSIHVLHTSTSGRGMGSNSEMTRKLSRNLGRDASRARICFMTPWNLLMTKRCESSQSSYP